MGKGVFLFKIILKFQYKKFLVIQDTYQAHKSLIYHEQSHSGL